MRIRVIVDEVVTIKKQRNKYIGQQNLNRMNEGGARLYVYRIYSNKTHANYLSGHVLS